MRKGSPNTKAIRAPLLELFMTSPQLPYLLHKTLLVCGNVDDLKLRYSKAFQFIATAIQQEVH